MRERERQEKESADELSDKLEAIKANNQALIDQARKERKPIPTLYPHPDDIVRDQTTYRYKIVGPFNAEQAAYFEQWIAFQNLLLIWAEVLRRRPNGADNRKLAASWYYADLIGRQLPPSYNWSEVSLVVKAVSYETMSNKRLAEAHRQYLTRCTVRNIEYSVPYAFPDKCLSNLTDIAEGFAEVLEKAADQLAAKMRRQIASA